MEKPMIPSCKVCLGERLVYRLRGGALVPASSVEEWSFSEKVRRLGRIAAPIRCPSCLLDAPKTMEKSASS